MFITFSSGTQALSECQTIFSDDFGTKKWFEKVLVRRPFDAARPPALIYIYFLGFAKIWQNQYIYNYITQDVGRRQYFDGNSAQSHDDLFRVGLLPPTICERSIVDSPTAFQVGLTLHAPAKNAQWVTPVGCWSYNIWCKWFWGDLLLFDENLYHQFQCCAAVPRNPALSHEWSGIRVAGNAWQDWGTLGQGQSLPPRYGEPCSLSRCIWVLPLPGGTWARVALRLPLELTLLAV